MNSYKGKLLISTPDVSGDIFSRSVILVIDHNEQGAFGLILNKKNETATLNVRQTIGLPVDIYYGGPVENDKIFVIVKGKNGENSLQIDNEHYFTEDAQAVLEKILSEKIFIENVKVFSGYSGWSAMQLEREIKRKVWTVVEIYNLDYTSANDQNLWKSIMQNLGGEFLLWANAPENISYN